MTRSNVDVNIPALRTSLSKKADLMNHAYMISRRSPFRTGNPTRRPLLATSDAVTHWRARFRGGRDLSRPSPSASSLSAPPATALAVRRPTQAGLAPAHKVRHQLA